MTTVAVDTGPVPTLAVIELEPAVIATEVVTL
jgi:hypothetical protein